jgi:hypothetical protein
MILDTLLCVCVCVCSWDGTQDLTPGVCVPGMEPKTSHLVGKCSATGSHPRL